MENFPANLTACYTDSLGQETLHFTPCREREHAYSLPFRGETLAFDDLDDLMALLPLEGSLAFTLPLSFMLNEGGSIPVDLTVTIAREPDGREGALFHCSASIEDQFYQTLPISDRNSWASESGLEGALEKLGDTVKPRGTFQTCFYCRYSDYEPNTSTGHLYCFVRDGKGYEHLASSPDSMDRKYRIWNLEHFPVDEFHHSAEFEPRPDNWGYRG